MERKSARRSRGRKTRKSRSTPSPKLQYMELPENYKNIDPAFWGKLLEFWSPIFKQEELLSLREKVHAMIAHDLEVNLVENTKVWSVCGIIKSWFPAYFIPMKENGGRDFSRYQIACCMTMILYGIISYRLLMNGQDYRLVFKGGKAIQMGLNAEYKSEDIDILVDPIQEYDPKMIQNISGHLALLIQWILPFPTSVLPPGTNPHVYKLSFIQSNRSYRAFSDVDFKQIDLHDPFFKDMDTKESYVDALEERVWFRRPIIERILEEKIFYYSKYKRILEQIQREAKEIEGETIETCTYFMDKFGRAIVAIAPNIDLRRL